MRREFQRVSEGSRGRNGAKGGVGLRLCRKLWLDAGSFRTHLGTESLAFFYGGLAGKRNIPGIMIR